VSDNFGRRIKLAAKILLGRGVSAPIYRNIPPITPEEVKQAKTFFPLDKFFIFGHARSGTTLLTRLVRLHPQVHCNYQAHFFTRQPLLESLVADERVGEWLSRRSNRWNKGGDLSALVLRAAADMIMERDAHVAGKGNKGCVVGDKSPNSLMNGEAVRLMVKVYPDAHLIFIVRDGRDAVLSHRFQAFIDQVQTLSQEDLRIRQDFAHNPQPYLSGQYSLFTETYLNNAAQGWARNVTETDREAREILGKNYHHLQYEQLLDDPYQEMTTLWEFLGVDPTAPGLAEALRSELSRNPDADWQRQKAGEIGNALEKGKSGTWREMFTERDRQIFREAAGDALAAWGYEE